MMQGTLEEVLAANAGRWLVIEIVERDAAGRQPRRVRLLGAYATSQEAYDVGDPLTRAGRYVTITYEPRSDERGAPVV